MMWYLMSLKKSVIIKMKMLETDFQSLQKDLWGGLMSPFCSNLENKGEMV